jgi:hypothetical protein
MLAMNNQEFTFNSNGKYSFVKRIDFSENSFIVKDNESNLTRFILKKKIVLIF